MFTVFEGGEHAHLAAEAVEAKLHNNEKLSIEGKHIERHVEP
jgi:hypothetical protein